MLTFLTKKGQKAIAWFLFGLFYSDMLFAAVESSFSKNNYSISSTEKITDSKLLSYTKVPNPKFQVSENKGKVIHNSDLAVAIKKAELKIPSEKSDLHKNKISADQPAIGGPGQPEMSTFKSVGADNMVNLFTGDFSYNIPLMDVDGYPINIFYNAEPTMDQEASWVGLGWNINPGTISRNMRGLPDDFDGNDSVKKVQSFKPDITVGVNASANLEAVGYPFAGSVGWGAFYNNKRGFGLDFSIGGEFIAHRKISAYVKTGKKTDTVFPVNKLKLKAGINLNSQTGLTPSISFSKYLSNKDNSQNFGLSTSIDFNSRTGFGNLQIEGELSRYKQNYSSYSELRSGVGKKLFSGNILTFARNAYTPSIRMPITNFSATFRAQFGFESGPVTSSVSLSGNYIRNSLAERYRVQKKPAFGYMYYEKGNGNKNALLDFNRLNDGTYTDKTPIISVPVYTYDVFTITGEGTGGSFRGYRGNMGFVKDGYTRTDPGKYNLSLEFAGTNLIKGGTIIGGVLSTTAVGGWESNNALKQTAAFKESDKLEQKGFYFKNPAEKAIIDEDYYNNMGQDKLIRPVLGTTFTLAPGVPGVQPIPTLQSKFQVFDHDRNSNTVIPINMNSYRKQRDKRSQVISYLTAFEADRVGLDKYIYSYTENEFKPGICYTDRDKTYRSIIERYPLDPKGESRVEYRKRNHISEITVLEGSKRYVYGLPVYQIQQKEVTFGTDEETPDNFGRITYQPGDGITSGDNTPNNKKGKDGFYEAETINGYAHSFLLTAILSPDYSDLTGDGISDDDLGTAIKFNYSRANNVSTILSNSWKNMQWRMPFNQNQANFNRGLVTANKLNRDNKAFYTYGTKELWYTHSIESKNMIATFRVSDRNDGWGVNGENGGINTSGACQKKLDRIDLYSKADFIKAAKYNKLPKPIKTVYFKYSYDLCPDFDANDKNPVYVDGVNINAKKGKLTLRSIYFTYNNNNHQKNKYVFKYFGEDSTSAVYNSLENDRWGNYKPHSQNKDFLHSNNDISNEDYPYTIQDKTTADGNAAMWSLNQILLPSGAKIDVNYEADDYAFVQDRRAGQMSKILGFSSTPSLILENNSENNKLYSPAAALPWNFEFSDYRYVFFDAPVKVKNAEEIKNLYLKDLKQLLLKLWVKIPNESGYEPIFVYCDIEDAQPDPNSGNATNGYARFYVKTGGATRHHASQIMETVFQFLRDQIPGRAYPGNDVSDQSGIGQVIKAVYAMFNNIFTGVLGFENTSRWNGWSKEADLSRSVARLSNPYFKKLGGGHRVKSIIITDNFKKMLKSDSSISSTYGQVYDYTMEEIVNNKQKIISSGVASYEPGIGNEENPFREIYKYANGNIGGPTANSNFELPVAETFFPSPGVGYARVTVRSIHNNTNKNIKSGVGMQESQFYTTKDFPTVSEYTDFDPFSRYHFKPNIINRIFNFAQKDYVSLSQGFRILLNDMNGKLKRQASYAENDLKNPINKTTYYYKTKKIGENKLQLDNIVPVVAGADGLITYKLIGKDIEIMNDFREHFSTTRSIQVPLNTDIFQVAGFPVILPSIFRAVFRSEDLFRSATTLKVVTQFGILDSVENNDNGSVVGTKNLLYNAETGDVLVSRTNNEFDKPIYNFNYPAYWANEGMGPAYKNIDATAKNVLFRNGKIEGGLLETEVNTIFESGDEIYVFDNSKVGPLDNPGCIASGASSSCITLPLSNATRIWALDIAKDNRNTKKEIIFIDRNGTPFNGKPDYIRIIRSGRRNMLDATVGSITSMANPIKYKSDNVTYEKLQIDDNTDVVNSGALVFKEKWKTQDAFFTVQEVQRVVRKAQILNTNVYVNQDNRVGAFLFGKGGNRNFQLIPNQNYFVAAQYDKGGNGYDYKHRSWHLFDFDLVPNLNSGSNVLFAKIYLPAHPIAHEVMYGSKGTGNAHDYYNPHFNRLDHSNNFILSRMLTQWPLFSNTVAWRNLFDNTPSADLNTSKVLIGAPPNGGFSQKNYYEDITPVVMGMLKDKFNPLKNYSTALMINLFNENSNRKDIARVCFDTGGYFKSKFWQPKIHINLEYYNCSESDPIVYQGPAKDAPTIPPPGYVFCNTDDVATICKSVFSRDTINPYVLGLLGNWRPFKSYVYNGLRREQSLTDQTNIGKDGIIKNFETFWTLANENSLDKKLTITNENSQVWLWNSEITQYNRKGAELENVDPLGIYKTGLFGYNEALPIAVVHNSKLRLSAFDGFEDYYFKDQSCDLYCQPNKRHFETKINLDQLDTSQAHTGKYSYKTLNGNLSTIKIKTTPDNTGTEPDIFIQATKTTENVINVSLQGEGLLGLYGTNFICNRNRTVPNDMVNINSKDDLPGCKNYVTVNWNGQIQVTETGDYSFNFLNDVNDWGKIFIKDSLVFHEIIRSVNTNREINLTAGVAYPIRIEYRQENKEAFVNLAWKKLCDLKPSLIPKKNLYMPDAPVGPVTTAPVVCTKIDKIKAQSNFLIDGFNLIPDPNLKNKMVASLWVKKGAGDCHCTEYTGFEINFKDQNGNPIKNHLDQSFKFITKGNIIEGWQLYESEFYVPSGTEISLNIDNSSGNDSVFIDDLRIHPFNANMKSFVYNPLNLKPAAELDENNYATFYEYDDDGSLIRVKKETRLGIKTIQETRSGLQKGVTEL